MTATLTPQQMADIIRSVELRVAAELSAKMAEDYDFVSPAKVCGMLDITANTLKTLPIRRYIIEGRTIRYKLSDIKTYLLSVRE